MTREEMIWRLRDISGDVKGIMTTRLDSISDKISNKEHGILAELLEVIEALRKEEWK